MKKLTVKCFPMKDVSLSKLDWYVSCLVANAVTTVKQSILVKKTKTFGSIKSLSVTEKVHHACP